MVDMTKEDKKVFQKKFGKGKLIELSINPSTKEISMIYLEYSDFDGLNRQMNESFETIEGNESRAIQLLGEFFPTQKEIYRYLDCQDGFADTEEAKNWTKVYTTAEGRDMYDCSFKYILALKPGVEIIDLEGIDVIDGFFLVSE